MLRLLRAGRLEAVPPGSPSDRISKLVRRSIASANKNVEDDE